VFSPYGEVHKVVTFMKGSVMKALIQFRFLDSAIAARMALDGKEMFVGCCLMRIQYSTLMYVLFVHSSTASHPDQPDTCPVNPIVSW
jgi:hypothetical protein